ncbi:hypothetical protein D3C73_776480 [compost metagenome]
MSRLGADALDQLAVGVAQGNAFAGRPRVYGLSGLQTSQRGAVTVIQRTRLTERDVDRGAFAWGASHGHSESCGVLRGRSGRNRRTTGILERNTQAQGIVLARLDGATADNTTLGIQELVGLAGAVSGNIAKHDLGWRGVFQAVLHRRGGGRVVDIELRGQGRLTTGRNGQRAATTRSDGRPQGRRDGQTLGVGHLGFDICRCVTRRRELEGVALSRSPVERHREPVDHRRRCGRRAEAANRRVIWQAPNGVVGGGRERDLVIVDGQLASVLDAYIEVAGTGTVAGGSNAALRHLRGTVDAVEQVRTEITVLVDALSLDTVHLIGDDQRHTTQFVHGRIEYFAAITQQAADFTTGHDRRDIDGARTTIDLQRQATRIIFTRDSLKLVDCIANHQWLTATQIDINIAVAFDKLCAGEGR